MPEPLSALALFAAVLVLIIWQPRGLSIGWPSALGGALAIALGIVSWSNVGTVVSIVWDATLAFVAIILISLVSDAAGLFEWSALHMTRLARGSGRRLFVWTVLLGAAVAAFFANDGAALILTPIVYSEVKALKLHPAAILAFVMAGGFIADATSSPLVISNLVNIVSADFFHIGFVSYAARMLPVDVVALLASLGALYLFFRRDLPQRVPIDGLQPPASAIHDPVLFRQCWWVLGALLVGYLISEPLHLPISTVAMSAAIVLLILARRSPVLQVPQLLKEAPWQIVIFSIGMYVVVFGLRNAGLTALVGHSIDWAMRHGPAFGMVYMGYLAAFLSSVMNNLPTVMIGALAIHGAHLQEAQTFHLALANVIGSDLGPKLTPIGSLATLLWLHVLARRGMKIGWGYYMRVGFILTLPVLGITLVALAVGL